MHYAAIDEPSLPADIAPVVIGVIGLDDPRRAPSAGAERPSPRRHRTRRSDRIAARSGRPTSPPSTMPRPALTGTGETLVIAGAYAWKDTDNTSFAAQWGLPNLPTGSGQVCTGMANAAGCKFSMQNSLEIALDVEYAHATAPGARVLNYMSASTSLADFTTMYNRIVTDNPGHVVSTSWGACEVGSLGRAAADGRRHLRERERHRAVVVRRVGDNGSLDCNNTLSVDNPANSPHVIGVGGTTPTCSAGMTSGVPACGGYGSEVGWSGRAEG
jgi:subtilase family serine protease